MFSFRRTQRTRRLFSRPMFHHCADDHHNASTCRLPLGPIRLIQLHAHVNLHFVVCPCPHRPRHSFHSFQISGCLRCVLHANLRNCFPSTSSNMFASSACPMSSGLTAALLSVFDASLNSNPSSNASRCLSLASHSCPSSVHLKILHNVSISRTLRFPQSRLPRTLTWNQSHMLDLIFLRSDSVAANVTSSPCNTTRT